MGKKGEFLYNATIPMCSSAVDVMVSNLPFVEDILIISIFRGIDEEFIAPRGTTMLTSEDRLILMCKPEVLPSIKGYFEVNTGGIGIDEPVIDEPTSQ